MAAATACGLASAFADGVATVGGWVAGAWFGVAVGTAGTEQLAG